MFAQVRPDAEISRSSPRVAPRPQLIIPSKPGFARSRGERPRGRAVEPPVDSTNAEAAAEGLPVHRGYITYKTEDERSFYLNVILPEKSRVDNHWYTEIANFRSDAIRSFFIETDDC